MTSRDFCFWLQGFFELRGLDKNIPIDGNQAETIRRHLSLVFLHEIDPSFKDVDPTLSQAVHDGSLANVANKIDTTTKTCPNCRRKYLHGTPHTCAIGSSLGEPLVMRC